MANLRTICGDYQPLQQYRPTSPTLPKGINMSESIAQHIINNNPPAYMSNELIHATVAVISNEMTEEHVADEQRSFNGFEDEEHLKGNKGFFYRVNKITPVSIMDYLVGLGHFDSNRGMVDDYWIAHHKEVVDYCQKTDPYAGEKSAVRTLVRFMRISNDGKVDYSDDRIKAALYGSATEGADLTAMIIRQYAVSCVCLALIESYKLNPLSQD